jgi:ribosomal protein S18 acetylase RimI-like enzyme
VRTGHDSPYVAACSARDGGRLTVASEMLRPIVSDVDHLRGSALNEQELWREMVRWSGGRIVEERGVLLVSGPSAYLRVAMRTDARVDGSAVVARALEFFGGEPAGFIVLVRRPDDEDVERAALAEGFRAGWTEQAMALTAAPPARDVPADVEVRVVADEGAVVDYGRVVALANDDPGERERAPLLFHDATIVAPHVAAFVAYASGEPVACAMTLVSHRVAGVFYVGTVEHARRRGLGDALTRVAARSGFELGARAAWLGASEMGAGLYRRIGFQALGSTLVELESPGFGRAGVYSD